MAKRYLSLFWTRKQSVLKEREEGLVNNAIVVFAFVEGGTVNDGNLQNSFVREVCSAWIGWSWFPSPIYNCLRDCGRGGRGCDKVKWMINFSSLGGRLGSGFLQSNK